MMRAAGLLLLLSVSSLVSLAIVELALRQFVDRPLSRPLPQVRYDSHDRRGFTLRPLQKGFTYEAAFSTDARGLRRTGIEPTGPREVLILGIGDSFTFGMGVADDETWPARLAMSLADRGRPDVSVVNAGVVSYGWEQELDLLSELAADLSPDLVIHGLYWNDYMRGSTRDALTPNGYFKWNDPESHGVGWAGQARQIASGSALYVAARGALQPFRSPGGALEYERAYQSLIDGSFDASQLRPLEKFYDELSALGAAQGFDVMVIVMPVIGLSSGEGATNPYVRWYRDFFDRSGLAYVDGPDLWSKRPLEDGGFLPSNRHLNADGYAALNEALVPHVEEWRSRYEGQPGEPGREVGRVDSRAEESVSR